MREMIACSKTYEEKIAKKACEDLRSLTTKMGEMAEKLWGGKHSRRLKGSTKTDLEVKVKRTSTYSTASQTSTSLSQLMTAGEEELLGRFTGI